MIDSRSESAVALGGNLPFRGDATARTLIEAVRAMASEEVMIRAVSRFFRTPCFPAGAGPDYVNAVVVAKTHLSPERFLHRLHDVENAFGRARAQRWGMRTLDLDVLTWGDAVLPQRAVQREWLDLAPDRQREVAPDRLILPHPRMQERAFVLVPLCDVLPEWTHPVLQKTARALCDALPDAEIAAVKPI